MVEVSYIILQTSSDNLPTASSHSPLQHNSLCRDVHDQIVTLLGLEEAYIYGLSVVRGRVHTKLLYPQPIE